MESLTETDVRIRRAQDGCADSASWIAERLWPFVLGHARSKMNRDDRRQRSPEDLAGHVMMIFLERLPRLEAERARIGVVARSFLRNTLSQHLFNLRRRDQRVPTLELEDELPTAGGSAPSEHLRRSETTDRVISVLRNLPRRDREILIARFWEEEAWEAIAAQHGLTAAACRQRARRALMALRDVLEHDFIRSFLAEE